MTAFQRYGVVPRVRNPKRFRHFCFGRRSSTSFVARVARTGAGQLTAPSPSMLSVQPAGMSSWPLSKPMSPALMPQSAPPTPAERRQRRKRTTTVACVTRLWPIGWLIWTTVFTASVERSTFQSVAERGPTYVVRRSGRPQQCNDNEAAATGAS